MILYLAAATVITTVAVQSKWPPLSGRSRPVSLGPETPKHAGWGGPKKPRGPSCCPARDFEQARGALFQLDGCSVPCPGQKSHEAPELRLVTDNGDDIVARRRQPARHLLDSLIRSELTNGDHAVEPILGTDNLGRFGRSG